MGGGPCHRLKGVEEIVFIENVEGRAYIIIICCEISRVEFAHLYTSRLVEICLNILLLLIKYFITFSKILSLNICTKLEIKKGPCSGSAQCEIRTLSLQKCTGS